jgi:L-asparaginase
MQVFFSPAPTSRSKNAHIAVLGTGGTIAGRSPSVVVAPGAAPGASSNDHVAYKAGEVGIDTLMAQVADQVTTEDGVGVKVVCQQVAQIDSKDADWAFWWALAAATAKALDQASCAGVVITHGTDTLEETAWFLACVLGERVASKPVVLTCAMRPATALVPDGPQNLSDALALAWFGGACGVQVCVAGASWSAQSVQKVHPYRLHAFDGADTGPVAYIEAGRVRPVTLAAPVAHAQVPISAQTVAGGALAYAPAQQALSALLQGHAVPPKPWVELVVHTAAAHAGLIDVLHSAGVDGVVVQATGNGTLNQAWLGRLHALMAGGLPVWCATRCQAGHLVAGSAAGMTQDGLPFVPGLSGVKSRVSLMLSLLA